MKVFDTFLLKLYERMMDLKYNKESKRMRRFSEISEKSWLSPTAEIINIGSKSSLLVEEGTHIKGNITVHKNGKIHIGRDCFLGENSRVWAYKNIEIGDNTLISHNCFIVDSDTHPQNPYDRHKHYLDIVNGVDYDDCNFDSRDVIIGKNVWIASGCCILKGVHIGDNAIIGAGSVVVSDIPADSIAFGNPAKIVRTLNY